MRAVTPWLLLSGPKDSVCNSSGWQVLSHGFFLLGCISYNQRTFTQKFAQQIPTPLIRTAGTMESFLVSLLSPCQALTVHFVNLSLTLTGNKKKRERRLWSLPSSNIMESVSLGFGRKRCWWQHDRVMPSRPWMLFQMRPPPNTDRGPWGAHNATCHQAALGNTNRVLE